MPSPETQKKIDIDNVKDRKRFDAYQTTDPIEAKAIAHEQRLMWSRKLAFKALTSLVVIGIPVAAYTSDVLRNQALQDDSSIIVEKYDGPLDTINDNQAVISIDGVGTNNADTMTKYMVPAVRQIFDGQRWSVNQNDAHLTPRAIATEIISLADKEGVTSAVFVGQSAGGSETMQVQEIVRDESNITITGIFLAATPDGLDGLKPEQQKNISTIKAISRFPGAAHSTVLRTIGQMVIESDKYMPDGLASFNLGDFISTLNQINDAIKNKDLPGSWLMVDQELSIEDASIETRTANIGKAPESEVRPTMVYLEAASDPVVKDKLSSQHISRYAKKAGVPYFSYYVPRSIHGQPQFSPDSYMKVLKNAKDKIQASIHTQISLANLHRVTSMFKPNLPKG